MTMTKHGKIESQIGEFYDDKLKAHGATHWAVDWHSTELQFFRFKQLLRLHENPQAGFSINDYGCGYGSLITYLTEREFRFKYTGFDVSPAMIDTARKEYPDHPNCTFVTGDQELVPADYTVAGGIFSVRLDNSNEEWLTYVLDTLDRLWELSLRGMAVSFLTTYLDAEYMREYLYYANPTFLFDHCKNHYSNQVALLHDYGLYEFTILVRREEQDARQIGEFR
jgi:SAM-dependent methyltransferase